MRKSKGFTMIELMMVVVVIGILITIAIPNYARSVERSRCSFAMNMLKSMRNAAILYYRENQTFIGMSLLEIETLSGAKFYSDDSHPDWTFDVLVTNDDNFTLQADRTGGPHGSTVITLTQDSHYDTSTYPYENPGQF